MKITIGDRIIRTRAADLAPQFAVARAIERLYGRGAFMRPRDGERWSGNGHTFQGYVDVYRSIPRSTSDELVAEHICISV